MFLNTIINSRNIIMPILFTLTLIAAAYVNNLDKHLVNPAAAKGIVSLEVAWNQDDAEQIRSSWETDDKKDLAIESLCWDYAFIVIYCLMLGFLTITRASQAPSFLWIPIGKWQKVVIAMIVAIAILDVFENIMMTLFLNNRNISAKIFGVAAYAKFALLIAVAVHQLKFVYLTWVLKALKLYVFGIASVAMIFFVLINLTQGRDLVMMIGEEVWPRVFALVAVVLWAFYSWYSSRLLGYAKAMQPNSSIPDSFHEHFPRLIAYNAVVSIQAAILSLPTFFSLTEVQLWVLVLFQNMLYFIFVDLISDKEHRIVNIVFLAITGFGYFLSLFIIEVVETSASHVPSLRWIAFLLFLSQFAMLFAFLKRRSTAAPASGAPVSLTILKIKIIDVPAWIYNLESGFFKLFNVIALLGFIFYSCGFILYIVNIYGSLTATVISLAILVGIANFVTIISVLSDTNIFFYLFILAFIIGRFWDPYEVRTTETENKKVEDNRLTLTEYVDKWIDHRDSLISKAARSNKHYPVYLVIADGGASRSGYWVASVLSKIQDKTVSNGEDLFSDHLLALAGASGGSVGNATFYSLLHDQSEKGNYLKQSQSFLANDFLSPVIMRWLGSDLIQHVGPIGICDRATALELVMERCDKTKLFDSSFRKAVDTTGRMPMLFINVTNVQQGTPAVVSTVRVHPFSTRIDVMDSVASLSQEHEVEMRYSTAVVLGARFPYVSPGGSIGNESYVDGGYFDNTGAGIIHEMMQTVDTHINNLKDSAAGDQERLNKLKSLRFKVIYISNGPQEVTDANRLHPVLNDLAAPVITVLGTYGSQTEVNNQRLRNFMTRNVGDGSFDEFNLYRKNDKAHYPMNWVISQYGLRNMDDRLKEIEAMTEFDSLTMPLSKSPERKKSDIRATKSANDKGSK